MYCAPASSPLAPWPRQPRAGPRAPRPCQRQALAHLVQLRSLPQGWGWGLRREQPTVAPAAAAAPTQSCPPPHDLFVESVDQKETYLRIITSACVVIPQPSSGVQASMCVYMDLIRVLDKHTSGRFARDGCGWLGGGGGSSVLRRLRGSLSVAGCGRPLNLLA